MILTGAQIFIEILKEHGVDTVFGYPGSSVLEIYDELYKNRDSIRHILTSHEQGAAHAADGYARVSGKTGVCIATSGPGATNLVTGIASAYMDSVPVLAITCNVEKERLGKDSFQEVDITGITMPVTKHGYIVKDINNLAKILRRAFEITVSGRPGPVIVDITKNVLTDTVDFEPVNIKKRKASGCEIREKAEFSVTETGPDVKPESNSGFAAQLKTALKLLKNAKRPLVLAGGGVNRGKAGENVQKLAEILDAPVICSLMGKGSTDETNIRFCGMLGVEGSPAAGELVKQCDLLVALGIRFSDRMTSANPDFAGDAKIVQLDIDPAEINKNVIVDAYLLGNLNETMQVLLSALKQQEHITWNRKAQALKMADEKNIALDCADETLSGREIIDAVNKITKGKAIITTEVGQHQLFAAMGYKTAKEGMFVTSGGLGTMGYGLSAAIGAKLARPGSMVINFAGDGCFRMNMNELLTASRHKIPVVQIVFDNQVLGLVYHWQNVLYEGRYSETEFMDRLDFVKLSEALGVKAYRITKPSEIEKTLRAAIKADEPVVIDCVISAETLK